MSNTDANSGQSIATFISRDFISLFENETVASALEKLRASGKSFKEKSSYLYVVDACGCLAGVLAMKDILVGEPPALIGGIMSRNVISISEKSQTDEAKALFQKTGFFAVPVVNQENHLVGVVTCEHFGMDKHQRHLFSGQAFPAFGPEEVEGKTVREVIFRRLPWLLISVTIGLFCAYILGLFIGRAEAIIALIFFLPIVLGLAGSVGTQSGAVTSRSLCEGKLSIVKMGRLLAKEAGIGCGLGLTASLLIIFISILWKKGPILGLAFGVSLFASILSAGVLGFLVPLILRMFRIESRAVSNFFLLLVCDAVALVIYFLITLWMINPTIEIS